MIRDAIKISKIHLERLERSTDEIKRMGKLEDVDIEDFEIIKTIDTFIFRFMKLQCLASDGIVKRCHANNAIHIQVFFKS